MTKYEKWIADFIAAGNEIHGMCSSTCALMQKEFPELVLHGGYVDTTLGHDLHYWLVCPDGDIVDPTEEQFGGLQPEDYFDSGLTGSDVGELTLRILDWYLELGQKELHEQMASEAPVR